VQGTKEGGEAERRRDLVRREGEALKIYFLLEDEGGSQKVD